MEGTHENNNSSSTATSFLPLPTTSDHLASVTEQQEQPSFDGLFNRSQSKSSESSPVPLKSRSSDIPVTPHIPGALGQISHVHNPPIRSSTTSSLAFSSPSAISIVEESTRSRFRLTTGQSHALGGTLKATENENGSVESQSLVPDLDTGSSQPSELQAVTNEVLLPSLVFLISILIILFLRTFINLLLHSRGLLHLLVKYVAVPITISSLFGR